MFKEYKRLSLKWHLLKIKFNKVKNFRFYLGSKHLKNYKNKQTIIIENKNKVFKNNEFKKL